MERIHAKDSIDERERGVSSQDDTQSVHFQSRSACVCEENCVCARACERETDRASERARERERERKRERKRGNERERERNCDSRVGVKSV